MSTDVIPTKQQINTKLNATPTPKQDYTEIQKTKTVIPTESSKNDEAPKQDLLLGDDYKLSPANEPYDSCLPYPLSLFYPSVATQTRHSDFLSAAKLWSTRATLLKDSPQSKVVESMPQSTPPKVTEPTNVSVVKKEAASFGSSSGTSGNTVQTDTVLSIFSSNRSSEKSEATLLENVKDDKASSSPKESVKTASDSISRKQSSKEDETSYSFSDHNSLKEDEMSDSFSNRKESLKDDDKSDSLTGTYTTYHTYSFNSAEDIKLETEDTADPASKSIQSGKKSETNSIDKLLEKLDKKQSSSPTSSQKVYIEQVVQDLDKYVSVQRCSKCKNE